MAFQVYIPNKDRESVVSISKNHITLNKKLSYKFNTNQVELAFDPDTRTIRIKPSTNGIGLTLKNNKLGASGFFKHYNIHDKGKYKTNFDEKENAIYININENNLL